MSLDTETTRREGSVTADAVTCRGVGKTWNEGTSRAVVTLENIDLHVAPGELVVLLGPSGCGKSTLLQLIAGLQDATEGQILSHGELVTGPGPDRCLVFQESSLFPWLDVGDNVAFGLQLRGMRKRSRREVAARLLRNVGLGGAIDKRPSELSGGMRQRVAIARALAMEPRVILMDEPFAALDVQTRAKLQDHLLQAYRDSGASVVFVTHQIEEAVALADRIVVFTARPGRIKAIVPVDLPRPRDQRGPAFNALRDELIELLRDEVDRAFIEQEQM
jgi:NitT/TauT family transport system ATP-binding protein